MKRMSKIEIALEALNYVKEYDAIPKGCAYHKRTPTAIADYLLESKFAQVDEDCDWDDDERNTYFDVIVNVLCDVGVKEEA